MNSQELKVLQRILWKIAEYGEYVSHSTEDLSISLLEALASEPLSCEVIVKRNKVTICFENTLELNFLQDILKIVGEKGEWLFEDLTPEMVRALQSEPLPCIVIPRRHDTFSILLTDIQEKN